MDTLVSKIIPDKIDLEQIKKAADLVNNGQLVAFPTETVYGIACRVKKDCLPLLDKLKSRTPDKFYTLHIGSLKDLKEYVPFISLRAQKLIDKFWPGPLTVIFELDENDLHRQSKTLRQDVFDNLYRNKSIGIRFPDNPIALSLLQQIENPVVAPSANITGHPPATDAQQVLSYFSGQIPLILDGGPCKYKNSSTIVKIGKNNLEVLREGAFSKDKIEKTAAIHLLFVCTGNSCRSPMAEGIFKKYLAEKLQCTLDRLEKIGYKISSAGTLGISGLTASSEAIEACAAMNIDISKHRSVALTQELIEKADYIFVMSNAHLKEILELVPGAKPKCFLLAEHKDIADPIGQDQKFYLDTARLIRDAVIERVKELNL
jgi:protein-tyrosine phosphatase